MLSEDNATRMSPDRRGATGAEATGAEAGGAAVGADATGTAGGSADRSGSGAGNAGPLFGNAVDWRASATSVIRTGCLPITGGLLNTAGGTTTGGATT